MSVLRRSQPKPNIRTRATAGISNSCGYTPAPNIEIACATPGEGRARENPPNLMVTSASSMMPTAIVVSIHPMEVAVLAKGLTANRSTSTPKIHDARSESATATGNGNPASSPMIARTAPSINVSPWAKFTARAADHMMWKPSATSA